MSKKGNQKELWEWGFRLPLSVIQREPSRRGRKNAWGFSTLSTVCIDLPFSFFQELHRLHRPPKFPAPGGRSPSCQRWPETCGPPRATAAAPPWPRCRRCPCRTPRCPPAGSSAPSSRPDQRRPAPQSKHARVSTHIYIYIYIYICIYIYIGMHSCTHMFVYVELYAYMYILYRHSGIDMSTYVFWSLMPSTISMDPGSSTQQ